MDERTDLPAAHLERGRLNDANALNEDATESPGSNRNQTWIGAAEERRDRERDTRELSIHRVEECHQPGAHEAQTERTLLEGQQTHEGE